MPDTSQVEFCFLKHVRLAGIPKIAAATLLTEALRCLKLLILERLILA